MSAMRLVIALLLVGLLLPRSSSAKGDGKAEFDRGMRFYQAQEYDAALPYFQKAYEASGKRPSTIRALAQCERSLKMYDAAIKHFKEYVATKPSDKKEVEETIELLTELVAEQPKASPPPPPPGKSSPPPTITVTPPPPPPPVTPPKSPPATTPPELTRTTPAPEEPSLLESPWLWVGVGAVVLVGGGIALGVALSGGEADPYQGTSGVVLNGP